MLYKFQFLPELQISASVDICRRLSAENDIFIYAYIYIYIYIYICLCVCVCFINSFKIVARLLYILR
jgi:hypothetical protein